MATARKVNALNNLIEQYGEKLLPLQLDVTDQNAAVAAIEQAKDHFGRIDVLINNTGYGLFGSIEETFQQQARELMDTNFFGLLWLTQAVLPIMRQQGQGHISTADALFSRTSILCSTISSVFISASLLIVLSFRAEWYLSSTRL